MCIPGYWIAGFHGFHYPRKLLYPVGWGTLGFAFGRARRGARGRGPDRLDLRRRRLPVRLRGACDDSAGAHPLTTVIVDDGGYGMLRYDQDRVGAERFGVDLHTPDFAALARASGSRRGGSGPRRRLRRGARASRRGRAAEGAGSAGAGARSAADDVAELVPQRRSPSGVLASPRKANASGLAPTAPPGTRRRRRRRTARPLGVGDLLGRDDQDDAGGELVAGSAR